MNEPDRVCPPDTVIEAVKGLLGTTTLEWEPRPGGHTRVGKARIRMADGTSAFVKWADGDSGQALLDEIRVLSVVRGPFLPLAIARSDDPPVVIMEDLTAAVWPPPYPDDVGPLWDALEAKAAIEPPPGLPRLEDWPGSAHRWRRVATNPAPFLGLGVVTGSWLTAHIDELMTAEESVILAGTQLVHNDVFSGNIAFAGDRAVLVDWATAAVGNAHFDTAMAALSLRVEGRPGGAQHHVPDETAFAALLAGHDALEAAAPLPSWARADSTMRLDQLGDLRHALAWAADALGLPPPDGPEALVPV